MQRKKRVRAAGLIETCGHESFVGPLIFEEASDISSFKVEIDPVEDFLNAGTSMAEDESLLSRRQSPRKVRRRPQFRYSCDDDLNDPDAGNGYRPAGRTLADLTSCVAALCDSVTTVLSDDITTAVSDDAAVRVKVEPSDLHNVGRTIGRPLKTAAYLNDEMAAQLAHFRAAAAIVPTNEAERLEAAFCKRQYTRILATERQRQRRARMTEAERAADRELNRLRIRRRRDELRQMADRAMAAGLCAETQTRLNSLRRSLGMRPIGGVSNVVANDDCVINTVKNEDHPMPSDSKLNDTGSQRNAGYDPVQITENAALDQLNYLSEPQCENSCDNFYSVPGNERLVYRADILADASAEAGVGSFVGKNKSIDDTETTSTSQLIDKYNGCEVAGLPALFEAIEASARKCRALTAQMSRTGRPKFFAELRRIKERLAEVEKQTSQSHTDNLF